MSYDFDSTGPVIDAEDDTAPPASSSGAASSVAGAGGESATEVGDVTIDLTRQGDVALFVGEDVGGSFTTLSLDAASYAALGEPEQITVSVAAVQS